MIGLVIHGTNNVFQVRTDDGALVECRIKGKILKCSERFYNPLAPGDRVIIDLDRTHPGAGLILDVYERKNAYARWNQKGKAPQLLAANLDLILCVASAVEPPFRPRFLDRVLLQADTAGIPPVIILNKCDLEYEDPDIDERLEDYHRIGYKIVRVSAVTGFGLDELQLLIRGRSSALVGQSGIGKSSLLNALIPGLARKTAELSAKFNRGIHTTTMAALFDLSPDDGGGWIIDTPGIRRLVPEGMASGDLLLCMREFAPLAGACTFGLSCRHVTEPGCKILEAVNAGAIHEDRYESFLRIREELEGRAAY